MSNKHLSEEEELAYYKKLVKFQGDLMEQLYAGRTEIYRLISDFFNCSHILMLVCDEKGLVECDMYDSVLQERTERVQRLNVRVGMILQTTHICQPGESVKEYLCQYLKEWGINELEYVTCVSGKVNNALYSVILCHSEENEIREGKEQKLVNYVRLYMENRIFHEMVTYESQHDMLTRLYNRRYYFKCCQETYPLLASIGLFYFDVNNLKTVNDTYGHDAGDALLQKAAESIRCLTSDTVHGFRMGGDEFIVVAINCTKQDMEDIKTRWEQELQKVNEKYGGDPCIIAMGSAYGKGGFEIEELCKIADKRMYQDKMEKKKCMG